MAADKRRTCWTGIPDKRLILQEEEEKNGDGAHPQSDMIDVYLVLKGLHITCICLALAGLLLRTWWRHHDSPLLHHPATRTLPHANDTLLLAAGAGMALLLQQYPFQQPWLTAKLLAVCVYVIFGSLAIKHAPTPWLRHLSLIGALIAFVYIVSVAATRDPWPFY